jgi:sorbitol-specific phosphotransferase system component IIC
MKRGDSEFANFTDGSIVEGELKRSLYSAYFSYLLSDEEFFPYHNCNLHYFYKGISFSIKNI